MNLALKQYYTDRLKKLGIQIEQDKQMLETHQQEFDELECDYIESIEEEDMNADNTEHERAYERDIMEGLR